MVESVVLATKQIQKIHLNHYQRVQGMVYNVSMEHKLYFGVSYNRRDFWVVDVGM